MTNSVFRVPSDVPTSREDRRRLLGCLTVGAVLLLGGCGGLIALGYAVDDPQASSTPTPSASPVEPAAEPVPAGGDVTAQFLATQWGQQFEGVVMDVDQEFSDDGTTMRLEADTNLEAPRGAAESPARQQAVEVCEALKSAFRDDWGKLFNVRVNEMNGTVFVTNRTNTGAGCG